MRRVVRDVCANRRRTTVENDEAPASARASVTRPKGLEPLTFGSHGELLEFEAILRDLRERHWGERLRSGATKPDGVESHWSAFDPSAGYPITYPDRSRRPIL